MVQHKCCECNHAYCNLSASYCMHKDNYSTYITEHMMTIDAGYQCPLNFAQEDYMTVEEQERKIQREKARQRILEKMKINEILTKAEYAMSSETMFGTID